MSTCRPRQLAILALVQLCNRESRGCRPSVNCASCVMVQLPEPAFALAFARDLLTGVVRTREACNWATVQLPASASVQLTNCVIWIG